MEPIAAILVFIVICAIGIFILPYLLISAHPFPQPSGQWQIGTANLSWETPARSGIIAKVWYPADKIKDRILAPYIDNIDLISAAIADEMNPLYKLIFNRRYLDRIKTPSYRDVPIGFTQSGFPVILFSPGFSGINFLHTFYALAFASHGFIVIGIDHPGLSGMTTLDNGTIIKVDRLPQDLSQLLKEDPDEFDRITNSIKLQQVENISIVLDRITQLNATPDSFLHGKIDEHQIFAAGHSSGGAASFIACGRDRRISKAVNLDGSIIDPAIDNTNYDGKELYLINADRQKYPETKSSDGHDRLFAQDKLRVDRLAAKANLQQISFELAHHMNFTDLSLIISPAFGGKMVFGGEIDGLKLLTETSAIAIDFFNK
jgi:dienelactone hydrolase